MQTARTTTQIRTPIAAGAFGCLCAALIWAIAVSASGIAANAAHQAASCRAGELAICLLEAR